MDVGATFLAREFIALNDEYTWLGNTIEIVFKTFYCTRVLAMYSGCSRIWRMWLTEFLCSWRPRLRKTFSLPSKYKWWVITSSSVLSAPAAGDYRVIFHKCIAQSGLSGTSMEGISLSVPGFTHF